MRIARIATVVFRKLPGIKVLLPISFWILLAAG
jgi:hypothetical protein